MQTILRVALPTPLRRLFDYLPPIENDIPPQPGARILVPFGKQKKIGVIVEMGETTDCPKDKLKHAEKILDENVLFPPALLELIRWAARYYQASLGEVFEAALPPRLRKEMPPPKIPPGSSAAFPPFSKGGNRCALEKIPILNAAQKEAIRAITKTLGKFKTLVLEGVTGSGKTEVYIRAIETVLSQSKQVLILVPEIGLTPQLLARFEARFEVPIAVLHSGLAAKKRHQHWEMARTGIAPIVMGTRSAVFAPLKSPGLFIIDEEHDPSFKQQTGFRYHARDLLIMRASLENCPIVLGSATPSLETAHNLREGRYLKLRLPERAGSAAPPNLQVLDIRHKKLEEGLSSQLLARMREHLEKKAQVLLFLNRRGFAPVLMCFDCGFVAECKLCDAKLTLHYRKEKLQCHHCEAAIPVHKHCPQCQSLALNPLGVGTERLEAALKRQFPDQTILRLDKDTTSKKGSLEAALNQVNTGEANILLGTQMIAKGHHFPNVTLVAILNIDQALYSVDFRSTERLGQLITQVAGRAGRAERLGEVILQTCHPHHPLLKTLLEQGYPAFSDKLLFERQAVSLPPFSHQILIRAESKNPENSNIFLKFLKSLTLKTEDKTIKTLGPIPAPMERKGGYYRAQLLLQAPRRGSLQARVLDLISEIERSSLSRSVRWTLDVDPIEMY